MLFLILVDTIAIWFAVHYVFDALNGPVGVNPADLNEPVRTGE